MTYFSLYRKIKVKNNVTWILDPGLDGLNQVLGLELLKFTEEIILFTLKFYYVFNPVSLYRFVHGHTVNVRWVLVLNVLSILPVEWPFFGD